MQLTTIKRPFAHAAKPRRVMDVGSNRCVIIVCPQSPLGDPTPSVDDFDVARRLVATGDVLGIEVLDHIVVGDGRYYGFKEAGRVP